MLLKLGDKVSTDDISPVGARRSSSSAPTSRPSPSSASATSTPSSWPAPGRPGAASSWAASTTVRAPRARPPRWGPMHLGVRAVIVKSFARIHRANLINWGLVPARLRRPGDWDGDRARRPPAPGRPRAALAAGSAVRITNTRTGASFTASCVLTPRERDILLAGGVLAHTRARRPRRARRAAGESGGSASKDIHTMTQRRIRAVYMRGGTSRCLVFHEEDLPRAGTARDRILLSALGSPDPYGRQLDGLGGGISSLSKACIIGPPTHPEARRRLHVRPGRGADARGRLQGQLRQLLVGRRPLRHRREAGQGDRRARPRSASTTRTRRSSSWPTSP